jgi:hypothetical protein
MTTKTKKQGSIGLGFIWKLRLQLRAEGDKLWAEGNKLRAEGDKLRAEGNKLWAEGNKLWAEAIIECHGNIKLEWKSPTHCVLETGEEFTEAALAAAGRQ